MSTSNQAALQRLVRTVRLGQGGFSLILVNGTTVQARLSVLRGLRQAIAPTKIRELWLHPTVTDIYAAVKPHLTHQPLEVLSISGFSNLENLDLALQKANFSRDQFQQHCPFTLIWWINEEVSKKMRRNAPDLTSCLTTPIQLKKTANSDSLNNRQALYSR